MKRSRFTTEQIIGVLKEHEAGLKASELVSFPVKWTVDKETARLMKASAER